MCLDIGMSPSLFWDYSLAEIYALIESYNRKMKIESEKELLNLKLKASLNYILAQQIGEQVAVLFSKDARITPLEDYFTELFKADKEVIEEKKQKADMELHKAKMMDYAERHNSRRKKGEVK